LATLTGGVGALVGILEETMGDFVGLLVGLFVGLLVGLLVGSLVLGASPVTGVNDGASTIGATVTFATGAFIEEGYGVGAKSEVAVGLAVFLTLVGAEVGNDV
jgi:hypothetical protein